jgi:calcineurin-like phosphoesterase family protein
MKRVSIIDNQFSHGTSLGSGDLKVYPKNIIWDRTMDYLYSQSGNVFITENSFNNSLIDILPLERRIAFVIEPNSINSDSYNYLKDNHHKFKYILSHDKDFNRIIPNAIYYPFGGCWIEPGERAIYNKTKLVSIIASGKNEAPGHKLRHEFIKKYAGNFDLNVFGLGYKPVSSKLEALKDYCYSIIIENESSPGWFTEKLIDCLQTGTIPIYWGATDIHDYFDRVKGLLNFKMVNELFDHEKANPGAMFNNYKRSLPEVNKMFELSKKYTCPEDAIFERYPQLFS